jgi:hypothetical protein
MAFIIIIILGVAEAVLVAFLKSKFDAELSRMKLIQGGFNLIVGGLIWWFTDFTIKYNHGDWDLFDYGELNDNGAVFAMLQAVGVIFTLMGLYYLAIAIYEKIGEKKANEIVKEKSAPLFSSTEKPSTGVQSPVQTSGAAPVSDGWECEVCHTVNPRNVSNCNKCRTSRYS